MRKRELEERTRVVQLNASMEQKQLVCRKSAKIAEIQAKHMASKQKYQVVFARDSHSKSNSTGKVQNSLLTRRAMSISKRLCKARSADQNLKKVVESQTVLDWDSP